MTELGAAAIAEAMRAAIELARNGLGKTSPNPPVGCVVLSAAGDVVGQGWHRGPGQPHAEVLALREAGEAARGATAVVTLEPCAHTGRTGPCTTALIEAGVSRVVAAHTDPNPYAAGGAEILRAAGVLVEVGTLAEEAEQVTGPWLVAERRKRPFITWKYAATLDGRIAAPDGSSRWISGEHARQEVHELRSKVDTVLVGVGTVLADDPALTVRLPGYGGPQPRRIVVDSLGRTPKTARVLTDGAAPTWIATAAEVGGQPHKVDLRRLAELLFEQGSRWVLLEGGPTVAGAAIRAGIVDEVVAYVAPKLLGGGAAVVAEMGIGSISEALELTINDVRQVGADVRITARFSAG